MSDKLNTLEALRLASLKAKGYTAEQIAALSSAIEDIIKDINDNMTASSEKYLGSGNLLLFWTLLKSLLNGHESSINDLLARVKLLELILSADVTGNPYYVTFNTLTDVVVSSGIWNKSDGRIEF